MLLELININYKIGKKEILKDINLKIDTNKFIAVTGPNGSGKSTLMKIIMGLVKPTSGTILLNGQDITKLKLNERANLGISYAFQQPVKFKGITVNDLLETSSSDATIKEQLDSLKKVGLDPAEYLKRELDDSLSGGELKRIEISSILLRKSILTIFDEPEAGIDLWSFNDLINLFKKLREEINGTTLIISHQEKLLKFSDEIILMKNGEIAKIKNYEELKKEGDVI